MKNKQFEQKAWYRLLKVLYGASWFVVIALTIFTFFLTKPSGALEMGKSGFTCPNGKSYTWRSYTGFYTKNSKVLNETDNVSVLKTCGLYNGEYLVGKGYSERVAKADDMGFSETDITKTITFILNDEASKLRNNPPYKITWVTDETNAKKWLWSGIWSIIAFFVAYFILDTLKNIVLYVLLGKRFSYPLITTFLK